MDDLSLVPPFTPPLRGRLKMRGYSWADILKKMIDLFGGFRFRYADLMCTGVEQLLLDACGEALETFRFYEYDSSGERASLIRK